MRRPNDASGALNTGACLHGANSAPRMALARTPTQGLLQHSQVVGSEERECEYDV